MTCHPDFFYRIVFEFIVCNHFSGICLYVVGPSGAGKTALTAKVADSLYRHQQALSTTAEDAEVLRERVIVPVFCGSSAATADGQALLISLCRRISLALGLSMEEGCADILRMDYKQLVGRFHQLVREYAVAVFNDSLDQLSDQHLARSDLSYLRGNRPHPLSRIFVSTRPDERLPGGWLGD